MIIWVSVRCVVRLRRLSDIVRLLGSVRALLRIRSFLGRTLKRITYLMSGWLSGSVMRLVLSRCLRAEVL